mmetsp:Transcript_7096/g.10533  ORF Transcript_7096/g.10533 Transcript_7096/m.10533 type:complete len:84 (+) Transcript_7096:126-377(+)
MQIILTKRPLNLADDILPKVLHSQAKRIPLASVQALALAPARTGVTYVFHSEAEDLLQSLANLRAFVSRTREVFVIGGASVPL